MLIFKKLIRILIFVILYGSALFSFSYIFKLFFASLNVLASFIIAFILIYVSSLYFRKKYPYKFQHGSSEFSVFYLFLSFALSFFLLGLVFDSVKTVWLSFVNENPAYKRIIDVTFGYTLLLFPAFATIYPFWRFYSRKKGLSVNFIVALIYVCFWVLIIYIFARNIFGLGDIFNYIMNTVNYYYNIFAILFIVPLLKFIVGSLPLGWFYELYIGTVATKEIPKS